MKLVLNHNGFQEFSIKKNDDGEWDIEGELDPNLQRYALYTGTEDREEKEIIRNIYNGAWESVPPLIFQKLKDFDKDGKRNLMGGIIRVFMITASGAEGINLKNTRYVHVVEPYWHNVRLDQVIGRARRICSHEDLPKELRTIQVFIYLTVYSEAQRKDRNYNELMAYDISRFNKNYSITTDENLYEISIGKDRISQQILDVIKSSAIDCMFYNKKNPSVCFGSNVPSVSGDDYISYPTLEQDQQLQVRNIRKGPRVPLQETKARPKAKKPPVEIPKDEPLEKEEVPKEEEEPKEEPPKEEPPKEEEPVEEKIEKEPTEESKSTKNMEESKMKESVAPGPKKESLPPPEKYLQFHSKSAEVKIKDIPKDAMKRLSNFSADPVEFESNEYPTVEHAYQAQKYKCSNHPELVKMFYDGTIKTAEDAKKAGGKTGMKKYKTELDLKCWTNKHTDDIMSKLIKSKIERNPEIKNIIEILAKKNIHVVHFSRSDMYWGAQMNTDKTGIAKGENKLGKIYNSYIDSLR